MTQFEPRNPEFETRVRDSFEKQAAMHRIGATLERVTPGEVDILLPYDAELTQQHGFMHAGMISTVLDSACGYAAFTLMPVDAGVLAVEFKINLVAPAEGKSFLARGRVIRPGRTITACQGEAIARSATGEKTIAIMQSTIMAIHDRPGIED
ncbi:MAG: PaaI family thioesterase [Acidobacteriota bacterium]